MSSVLLDLMRYRAQKNTIVLPHWNRVLQDGGIFFDPSRKYMQALADDNQKYGSTLKLCINPALTGNKIRTSGVVNYATKSYDIAPHSSVLGPELITNGDFNNGGANWVVDGTDGTHTVTFSNGGVRYQSGTTTPQLNIYQTVNSYVGKFCKLTIITSSYVSGSLKTDMFGSNNVISSGVGTVVIYGTATAFFNMTRNSSNTDITIDYISVREVLINDSQQSTAANQPVLSKIAPVELPAWLNPNGGSNYMTHPTISFAANEAWSVEVVVNWNGESINNGCLIAGKYSDVLKYKVFLSASNNGFMGVTMGSGVYTPFTSNVSITAIQKATIYNFVYNGTTIFGYKNGIFVDSANITSDMVFDTFLTGRNNSHTTGKLYHYSIFSKALSASEVANRAALLRSIYPEIESVPIGTQTWAVRNFDAVCTPQGNLIPEVQAATNTEKLSGWNFTNWTDVLLSSKTSNSFTTNDAGGVSTVVKTVGKWYKLTIAGNTTSSSFSVTDLSGTGIPVIINGFGTAYFQATSTSIYLRNAAAGTTTITTLSLQEVGWSDSQNLYDYIYANTPGTVEQKTYAAVKAAAMWSHYNNDPANGAIYSKLYNDFAIKLLDMDIAYYNAANPTTPWGWDIPDESELETLQTTVGYNANSLEHLGTTYWTSGQGTNTTGFTALPAGYRKEDGTFAGINTTAVFGSTNMDIPRMGKSLRLIKR